MKTLNLLKTLLLMAVMLLGSGSVWGQTAVYTMDLNNQSSAFGTSNAYSAKSGTVSGVTWYTNAASAQSAAALWLGTNNATNRTNLTLLSLGLNGRGEAIATTLGVASNAVGYYAIAAMNDISNVGSITVQATATGGTAPSSMWCLYTTDNGATYTILDGEKSNPGTNLITFNAPSAIANAQYAFVWYSSAFGTYRTPQFIFYEPEACTAANLAFATPTVNQAFSAGTYTQMATSDSPSAITYSSSDQGVATVDPATGEVTFVSAGTTVISAHQDADDPYCEGDASYTLNIAYTVTSSVNDTDLGSVSQTGNVITVTLESCVAYDTPDAYIVTTGTATVSQEGNVFTVTPESDCHVEIQLAAVSILTVTLDDRGTTSQLPQADCTAPVTLPTLPAACAGWDFAGWATAQDASTFVSSPYTPTGDITLYAVYSQTTGGSEESFTMTSADITGISNSSYNTLSWTAGGFSFTGTVFLGTGANVGAIQMNSSQGNGRLYNTTAIPGLKSISVTRSAGAGALITIYEGNTATPTTTVSGTIAAGANATGSVNIQNAGNQYFTLQVGGATYISSITITYDTGTTTYDSNPPCEECTTPPTVEITDFESDASSIHVTATATEVDCPITERGFVYSTDENATLEIGETGVTKVAVPLTEDFELLLEDLPCATDYYVRAYAISSQGTVYSDLPATVVSTDPCPTITVTLDYGNGSVVGSEPTLTGVASVELPEAESCNPNWEFAGWATAAATGETTAPATLYPAGTVLTESADLYAVYSKSENGNSPNYTPDETAQQFVIAGKIGDNYFALPNSFATGTVASIPIDVESGGYVSTENAVGFAWTIQEETSGFTIVSGTRYLYNNGSNTNLALQTGAAYWDIGSGTQGTYRVTISATRGLFYRTSTYNTFGGYAISNVNGTEYYDIELLPIGDGTTTTYNSNPACDLPVLTSMTVKWWEADIDETAGTITVNINSLADKFGSLVCVETYATADDDATTVTVNGVELDMTLENPDAGNCIDYDALGLVSGGTVADIPVTLTNSAGTKTYSLTITDNPATGIGDDVTAPAELARCYSVTGIQVDCDKAQGVVIQQYTNGSAKKVLVK